MFKPKIFKLADGFLSVRFYPPTPISFRWRKIAISNLYNFSNSPFLPNIKNGINLYQEFTYADR